MSGRTDPLSQTTSFAYNSTDQRLRTITYPDSNTMELVPYEVLGLPTATTGVAILNPATAMGVSPTSATRLTTLQPIGSGKRAYGLRPLGLLDGLYA